VQPSAKTTIQSLALALHHPEEFSYGVLAGSNLTGLLLYGPPGTGKTMLVKAFARESGANVLEISAADVLSKYVGEGEKTIRAIFSLARKLQPCVVFIDEVDGLFGKRETCDKRHQRTEMNQFLREWDGLASDGGNKGAVLVVATNRPFDLDEAVLRRLPQRVLIDIPDVRGRASILRIHLREETLAPDVKIGEIASSTPFYTGSDLKNLVVAAALRSVRERASAKSAAAKGKVVGLSKDTEESDSRRVIRMEHLLKAKNEIRPAVSNEGLVAIREFHAKFGNTAKLD
jgi:SpoVK/Ycf46/Vps4 family AAA+-type ATPase